MAWRLGGFCFCSEIQVADILLLCCLYSAQDCYSMQWHLGLRGAIQHSCCWVLLCDGHSFHARLPTMECLLWRCHSLLTSPSTP